MFNKTSCGVQRLEGGRNEEKEKKKGEKIKQWKLREETVRRKFEENVRIRMEGNNGGWEN